MQITFLAAIKILVKAFPYKDIIINPSANDNDHILWIYLDKNRYMMYDCRINELKIFEESIKKIFEEAKDKSISNYIHMFMAEQNDDNLFSSGKDKEKSELVIDEIAYDV